MIRPSTAMLVIFGCYVLAGTLDYEAAKADAWILLENSAKPASLDECQRAAPERPRPDWSVSRQQRTGDPWHHRMCGWRQ